MVLQEKSLLLLWIAATAGNSLGACINWLAGKYITRFEHHRWYPLKPDKHHKAQVLFQRYGIWSLLFSWLPIIGDAFTLIAGIMRVKFAVFLTLVVIGKGLRYMVVIWLTHNALAFL